MTNIPKGNDKVGAPPIYVSEFDLQDEDVQLIIETIGFEETLYNLGFDKERWFESTETFYEVMECKHRTLSGKIVEGKRYMSFERLDDNWIKNGNPSEEAKMLSRKDHSYLAEIRKLSQRSY